MKKFIKLFFALILVVVLGIVGLITFVDPNEYRGYMVEKVYEKTGYKLGINGDLRWHIWPQISILVDNVDVTAPGAKEMMVKAENMRLDIELMPLLSKQLSVKQVLVKGAIIRLTDETKPAVEQDSTKSETTAETKQDETKPDSKPVKDWSFGLDRFEVSNSMFVLQQSADKDDLLTVRNINVLLTSKGDHQIALEASSAINRNQQDITTSVQADIDLKAMPQQVAVVIGDLTYQLQGEGFPAQGIQGNASVNVNYNLENKQIALTELKASANGDTIEGNINGAIDGSAALVAKLVANAGGGTFNSQITALLGDIPDLDIKIDGTTVNVNKLTSTFAPARQAKPTEVEATDKTAGQSQAKPATKSAPTAKGNTNVAPEHELAFLNNLNMKLSIKLNSVVTEGITLNNVVVEANNKQGNLLLNRVSTQLLGGTVSASGSVNAKGKVPFVQLNPNIDNIDMDALNKMLGISQTLSGKLNMSGKMSGSGINVAAIKNGWNADLNTRVDNARLNNINLKKIVQQAALLSNKDVKTEQRYEQYTQVRKLSSMVSLQKGTLRLTGINVDSDGLTVGGSGTVGLAQMSCNFNLSVKVMQGWQGKKEVVDILQSTAIPVHIYGPCSNMAYKVEVEQLLKDQLRNQATKAIDKYLGVGGKTSADRKDDVAKKVLGQIVGIK